MDASALALLPVWYAAFLLSLTCHEAAHAWAAHRGGDDTAYHSGQVSLSPWPHIRREPIGTILVPLLTYWQAHWMMGWASAPYDRHWEERHPHRAALMSAAGPAANLLLFAAAFVALRAGLARGAFQVPETLTIDRLVTASPGMPAFLDGVGRFLSIVLGLNLILAVFNLLPVPPLDGISVLAGLVAPVRAAYVKISEIPGISIVGLIIAWRVSPYVVQPLLRAAVMALIPG
ncbi:MAG TPA: site-2 protease family protein [Candidatus Polarisedimenticolaceae bacterium]|nr:site-2 protease family protein [Candidatus Polarisedimenticolaceae bacterium]